MYKRQDFLRTIPGLQHVEIVRPGYAIEYDCLDPTQLEASLAVRGVAGLYAAGQICGTSGYEEAAGQGWLAGVNAARFLDGEEPVVLEMCIRDSSTCSRTLPDKGGRSGSTGAKQS